MIDPVRKIYIEHIIDLVLQHPVVWVISFVAFVLIWIPLLDYAWRWWMG